MIDPIFNTDKALECVKSLEFVSEQLIICNSDSYHWKWAIVGIHNALQNFMVLSLLDGTNRNILKRKSKKEFDRIIRERKFGSEEEELNWFLDLYKDIKRNKKIKEYVPNPNDDKIITKLNDLRNDFIHFIPRGTTESVLDLLNILCVAINIINFLVNETVLLLNPVERKQIINLLLSITIILENYKTSLIQ